MEEGLGGGFGTRVELGPQYLLADAVLAERLGALAAADVAAHHQAVSILPARIAGEEAERVVEAGAVVLVREAFVGQPSEQREVEAAEPLALDNRGDVDADAQIAVIECDRTV